MDQARARALLAGERARLQRLLQAETGKPEAAELGDEVDDADNVAAQRSEGLTVTLLFGFGVDELQRLADRHEHGPLVEHVMELLGTS